MVEGVVENPAGRERLSVEEIGNLIAAGGNNEAKALTLLAMADGRIYTAIDLDRAMLSLQGERVGWRMGRYLPFKYCAQSLAPIGLVSREVLDTALTTVGYQITDLGKRLGIPLYGLLLRWSEEHNVSLHQIWGNTNSSSRTSAQTDEGENVEVTKRAPQTTLKILYELITSPKLPIQQVDLANRFGEDGEDIADHLERLSKASLIQYQTIEANSQFSVYKLAASLPTGELPIYNNYKSLTPAIFSVLQNHPDSYLTGKDVVKLLPGEIKKNWQKDTMPKHIHGVLAFLKRNRYAEGQTFYHGMRSEINLTGEQRVILAELLEVIDRFQDQDPEILARGKKLAQEIINKPDSVSDLLRRAKEASPHANRSTLSEATEMVGYLISSHPGITNKEIRELLEQEDKKIGVARVAQLTAVLAMNGAVSVVQEGSVKKFFPKDTPDQPEEL